jgi:hypothetical protein
MEDVWFLSPEENLGFCTIYLYWGQSIQFPIRKDWKESGEISLKTWTDWANVIIATPEGREINLMLEEALALVLRYRLVDAVRALVEDMPPDSHLVGAAMNDTTNIAGRSYALMTAIECPYFFVEVKENGDCSLQKIKAPSWLEAERTMDRIVSKKRKMMTALAIAADTPNALR